mgnify:FL=1
MLYCGCNFQDGEYIVYRDARYFYMQWKRLSSTGRLYVALLHFMKLCDITIRAPYSIHNVARV